LAANPNGEGYWLRDGAVIFPALLGKVAGTADENYWLRDGSVIFPAEIQPAASPSTQGLLVWFVAGGLT